MHAILKSYEPISKTHLPTFIKSNLYYNQHVDVQTGSRYQNDATVIVEMTVIWLDVDTQVAFQITVIKNSICISGECTTITHKTKPSSKLY